jgi:hypothetical protein
MQSRIRLANAIPQAKLHYFTDHAGKQRAYGTIPTNLLKIDPEYQRQLINKHVEEMKGDNFDPEAVRCLTVSQRKDGFFYIIDGMHRYELGKKQGVVFFLCEVYIGLTRKREAELFVKFNKARQVTPAAKFRAHLYARHDDETQIKSVVARNGFRIKIDKGARKVSDINTITALGTILWIVQNYDMTTLEDTLHVIAKVFVIKGTQEVQRAALKDQFLKGVATAIFNNRQKYNVDDLIDGLVGKDASTLYKRAEEAVMRRSDISGKIAEWIKNKLAA